MSARVVGWVPASGRFDAPVGAVARLGGSTENEVVVRIDGVSKTHARIVEQQDGYWLEDAGSRNGTWLNGERVTRAKLRHLDVITLGRFAEIVFVERAGEVPAPVATNEGLKAQLEWLDGPHRGTIIDIPRGEVIIGRAESCSIVIDSAAISRAHARLTFTAEGVTLEDLGSVNGTSLNGRPVNRATPVESRAEVDIGQARRFRVLIDGAPNKVSTPRNEGTTPIGAQDMEWMTRLVWSANDLEALKAAGVGLTPAPRAALDAAPAPAAAKPPAPPPTPVPAAKIPEKTGAETVVLRAERTQLATPALGAPPTAALQGAGNPAATSRDPGTAPAVPTFETSEGTAAQTLLGISSPFDTQTDKPAKPPADGGAKTTPNTQSARNPISTPTNLKSPLERTNLPPSTVLGFRDVQPTSRGVGSPPTSGAGTRGASGTPDFAKAAEPASADTTLPPIESVQLSGDLGVYVIARGTATVGRSSEATIRIDSREMSRIHAVLTVTDREVVVEDRGSINGTSVNGTSVTGRRSLVHGDRVCFADFEFRLEVKRTEGNQ